MSIHAAPVLSEAGRTLVEVTLTYPDSGDDHVAYEVTCDACGEIIAQVDHQTEAVEAMDDAHACAAEAAPELPPFVRRLLLAGVLAVLAGGAVATIWSVAHGDPGCSSAPGSPLAEASVCPEPRP